MSPKNSKPVYLLPFAMLCAACATSKPIPPALIPQPPVVVQTINQYPPHPSPEALTCLDDVPAPDAKLDGELFEWGESERIAGSDCRGKLSAIREWIGMWPK